MSDRVYYKGQLPQNLSNGGGKSCFFIVKVREDSSFFRLSRQNLRKEAGKRQKREYKKSRTFPGSCELMENVLLSFISL